MMKLKTVLKVLSVGWLFALSACTTPPYFVNPTTADPIPAGPLGGCNRKDFDKPPYLNFGVRPPFPKGNRQYGNGGDAEIAYTVQSDGKIELLYSQSEESIWFVTYAQAAMRHWKVTPATRNGQPVSTVCLTIFSYKLID
jgi:outer membrane biosynthesis protein TonB